MYTIFPDQKRGATTHGYLFSLGPRLTLVQKGGHTTHAYLFSYRTTSKRGGGVGGGGGGTCA